jgi:hypothetical protein
LIGITRIDKSPKRFASCSVEVGAACVRILQRQTRTRSLEEQLKLQTLVTKIKEIVLMFN